MSDGVQPTLQGRCLCGACIFELMGEHNWVGNCHCESCRRATASPFTTWLGQENGRWRLLGDVPLEYESSPGNTRGFCGKCGSPTFYQSERFPNERHFYVALLDHPEDVEPTTHFHADEMLPWIHLSDDLPRQ